MCRCTRTVHIAINVYQLQKNTYECVSVATGSTKQPYQAHAYPSVALQLVKVEMWQATHQQLQLLVPKQAQREAPAHLQQGVGCQQKKASLHIAHYASTIRFNVTTWKYETRGLGHRHCKRNSLQHTKPPQTINVAHVFALFSRYPPSPSHMLLCLHRTPQIK